MTRLHVVPETSELNGVFHVARLLAREDGGAVVGADDAELAARIAAADEVWVHGLWLPQLWRACWRALRAGKRLVRMTHGSLSPVYLQRQSKWLKRLVGPIERALFRRSRAVVATCETEAQWIRAYLGRDCPPVEVQDLLRFFALGGNAQVQRGKDAISRVHVLYLGRRHPLKGVDELERAVAELNAEGEIAFDVRVVSDAVGKEKENVWSWCDILCLPSLSENFGLVVAEALTRGKRVVVSDGAPAWRDYFYNHPESGRFLSDYAGLSPEDRVGVLKQALAAEATDRAGTVPSQTGTVPSQTGSVPSQSGSVPSQSGSVPDLSGDCPRKVRLFSVAVLLGATLFGCSPGGIERVEWTTMDTLAAVQVKGGDARAVARYAAVVKEVFAQVERRLNAFDPTSELNRLAKRSDAEVLANCDPLVRPCYAAAFRLRDETGGVFNPRWRGPGTLDLGAIAKGFAVDLAVSALAKAGAKGEALVDLGGNLRSVSGVWTTGVADPSRTDESVRTFALNAGAACATSARYFRGDHIRDGRTGSPVGDTCRSVTVVHPDSAMLADGLSTVLFLLGRDRGERFLKTHYPSAVAIWVQ